MNFKWLMFFLSVLLIIFTGCYPEDGFCEKMKYSGEENFSCSQMDKYFEESGNGIGNFFVSKEAVFSATYLIDNNTSFSEVITEKPDYIPSGITIEKMTNCDIAPAIGGVDCNEWYSFTFITTDNDTITFSSRKEDNYSLKKSLKYCSLKLKNQNLSGYFSDKEIGFYDTVYFGGTSLKTVHKYFLVEKIHH